MGNVKSLAKDTAVYGLSSIIGRFLNWCLVPLYTIKFVAAEYGVVAYVYNCVAFALIILTYGMETGFFRFANHNRWSDPMQVYSTALMSLACSGAAFFALILAFISPVSEFVRCEGHETYVWMMALCVSIDAFTALPFSYLRFRNKATRFAVLKLVSIGVNIGFNLFFILLCPWLMERASWTVSWFYDPAFGIGYIFLSNLISSVVSLLLLAPELRGFKWTFVPKLWREMIAYSAPLLVLGLAGIANQTLGQLLIPELDRSANPMGQLGIYSANYKIAIVMVMFIQAFRFAYEPFIFSQNKKEGHDAVKAYSSAMKYFIIAALAIFMIVMFYLDIIKYFISPRYFSGLAVVPIIMLAEMFFGVFFNLSVWYKLTDRTVWGMWFSLFGLAFTIGLNVLLVPRYGYMGCAWAAFGCYGAMMLASYFVGQAKYPIAYPLKHIGGYCILALGLYVAGEYVLAVHNNWINWLVRAVLLGVYALAVMKIERISPKSLLAPMLRR